MANYPTSVSTDANLYVAVNSLATSLVGALTSVGGNNGADIEVTSTAGFPSAGFITIDQEAISYTSLLSSPARFSGITRGADGTTATSHSAGSTTKHNVIAAHHNVLKEEVKAIETALGANLSNVVQTTGNQTVAGVKSLTDQLLVDLNNNPSLPDIAWNGDSDTGLYRSAANTLSIVTGASEVVNCNATNGVQYKGTTLADNASAGYVGEYVESVVSSNTSVPATGTFGDLTSISLTAGDWDVVIGVLFEQSGSTWSGISAGASTTSGNSGTGLVHGQSRARETWLSSSTTPTNAFVSLAQIRFSLSSTTTIYLKYNATYSAGTPTALGAISARRVR